MGIVGAGVDHLNLLDAGGGLDDELGQLRFPDARSGPNEGAPVLGGLDDSPIDGRVGVAEQVGREGGVVVDVAAASCGYSWPAPLRRACRSAPR